MNIYMTTSKFDLQKSFRINFTRLHAILLINIKLILELQRSVSNYSPKPGIITWKSYSVA